MNEKKIVESFFYYMWNTWCQKECLLVFREASGTGIHYWREWCHFYEAYDAHGAISAFFAYLDGENRTRLVTRALKLYDGQSNK